MSVVPACEDLAAVAELLRMRPAALRRALKRDGVTLLRVARGVYRIPVDELRRWVVNVEDSAARDQLVREVLRGACSS